MVSCSVLVLTALSLSFSLCLLPPPPFLPSPPHPPPASPCCTFFSVCFGCQEGKARQAPGQLLCLGNGVTSVIPSSRLGILYHSSVGEILEAFFAILPNPHPAHLVLIWPLQLPCAWACPDMYKANPRIRPVRAGGGFIFLFIYLFAAVV